MILSMGDVQGTPDVYPMGWLHRCLINYFETLQGPMPSDVFDGLLLPAIIAGRWPRLYYNELAAVPDPDQAAKMGEALMQQVSSSEEHGHRAEASEALATLAVSGSVAPDKRAEISRFLIDRIPTGYSAIDSVSLLNKVGVDNGAVDRLEAQLSTLKEGDEDEGQVSSIIRALGKLGAHGCQGQVLSILTRMIPPTLISDDPTYLTGELLEALSEVLTLVRS